MKKLITRQVPEIKLVCKSELDSDDWIKSIQAIAIGLRGLLIHRSSSMRMMMIKSRQAKRFPKRLRSCEKHLRRPAFRGWIPSSRFVIVR